MTATRKTWQVSPSPCPRCKRGVVLVQETYWSQDGAPAPRRSVWADGPARCSRGCALSDAELSRVLVGVYDGTAGSVQLPLLEAAG